MSQALYKIVSHKIADLSPKEIDAIYTHIYHADDGTFYLEQVSLDRLHHLISPALHKDLQSALNADDDFNFTIS